VASHLLLHHVILDGPVGYVVVLWVSASRVVRDAASAPILSEGNREEAAQLRGWWRLSEGSQWRVGGRAELRGRG
jgi:hypothetical protein